MKTVGIIPSRMNSVRFPGKALADIGGVPMVVRVFHAARESGALDEVYVATDSPEITSVCLKQNIPVLRTADTHQNPTSRTAEAASMVKADYYVMIGGDEPLLHPEDIRNVVTEGILCLKRAAQNVQKAIRPQPAAGNISVVNAMAAIHDNDEASDCSNIKVVCDAQGRGISAFRKLSAADTSSGYFTQAAPWHKFVSIGLYTREALDFFTATPPGPRERAEQFDLLRFIEHEVPVFFLEIRHRTLSVDTPSDLEKVIRILNTEKEINESEETI